MDRIQNNLPYDDYPDLVVIDGVVRRLAADGSIMPRVEQVDSTPRKPEFRGSHLRLRSEDERGPSSRR